MDVLELEDRFEHSVLGLSVCGSERVHPRGELADHLIVLYLLTLFFDPLSQTLTNLDDSGCN